MADGDIEWQHVGYCVEGQPFEIGGVDIWSQKARVVEGAKAEVTDPRDGRHHSLPVEEIGDPAAPIRFAARECSANVYEFYVPRIVVPSRGGASGAS